MAIKSTNKTWGDTKNINYVGKDFDTLKQNLIDYTKTYFPNSYADFNESSPGMVFIEQAAAIGDMLSFYQDTQLKESMLSNATERKLSPYIADVDEYQFYIPWQYNSIITYKSRILNVKDRYGNILETGPLEITEIEKKTSFSGKLHHILITARRVVENA